ncbi:MAG: TolC family protein [Sulfuricurvum sp.]|nr:TolC family protein [Sulfuricurvum sp.]
MRLIWLQILALPLFAAPYSLGELMDHAHQSDSSLKADKEIMQQYFYQKESLRLWDNPELSLSYANTKPEGIQRKNEYGIAVIQSIQKPALRSAKERILDAKGIQLQALIHQKENELNGNIRQKAYLYTVATMISEEADKTLTLATTLRQKGEKRFAQGAISKANLLKLQVEEEKTKQESAMAHLKRESALQLLSESARYDSTIEIMPIALPKPIDNNVNVIMEKLPMMIYYKAVNDEYRAEKEIAIESVIPGVKASLGYQEMFDQKAIVASLSMPIPILHRNEPLIKNTESKLVENHLREDAYRYETMQKILRYQQMLHSFSMMIISQQGVIAQSKEMESMAQKSYDEGYGTLLELLDARRVFLGNQKELFTTLENYYDTLGEIQKIIPPIEEIK